MSRTNSGFHLLIRMCTGRPLALLLSAMFVIGTLSDAAASITTTSGSILYVDSSSGVQPNLLGNYVSYTVTNDTGSTIPDAWVTIDSFTGSYVSLAPNETGVAHLGTMAAGATRAVFFYLQTNCSSFNAGQCNVATGQGFTVHLYSGPPSTNILASQAFSVTVQETIAAQANTVSAVVTSSNDPDLGMLLTVTVTGSTGTIGSAKTFYESPESYVDFPANVFQLYSTSVTFSGGNTGTYANQLLVPTAAFSSTASTSYSFVSTYRVAGMKTTTTAVSPVAFISSGNQVKHTNTSSYAALPPIAPTDNTLTLSKSVNSTVWPTGGVPTYTVQISNSGTSSVTVDELVDSLPTNPAAVTYVSGSSTFGGNSIGDPIISGSILTWSGTFTVPANGTATLAFQATVPNVYGTYTNSAIGTVGTTQIDSTIDTTDNAPATVSLGVGTPDLTVSKSHSGNFAQGQNGASYSITVSNIGTGPSSGAVTVVDTLPSGLTAIGFSGTGWSCTLATLTCTRSDPLSASNSYPVISITVNVAGNAPASVTNTATVSGGGEINTGNDTASDLTTITQLPDLTIGKSHTGNFMQGQNGASYTITISNAGTGPSSGAVTVVDTLPSGLTATALGGTGWNCTLATLTCTRSDALSGSNSYPVIALTVNVAGNAPASVTNSASVSGGGETNTGNDTATDLTVVAAHAPYATSTALVITPSNSVNANVTVTLTATVVRGTTPVYPGLVSFCDANAAECAGPAVFGTAQLVSNGTATFNMILGAGSYSIKAVFAGTTPDQGSESAVQALTVSGAGGYATTTTIVATGSLNSYTLTATVAAFGKPVPTGMVSFPDATTGNSVLANAALDPTSLTFSMAPTSDSAAAAGSPYAAIPGDFNNDGKVDLAIPSGSANTVGVLLGNGDGTFQTQATYATDPNGEPYAIAVGDFNADGYPDLVVTNVGSGLPTVSVLLGNGDGTFQPQVSYSVGHYPSAVVVGDFNGDGDADVAVVNRDDNTISVLLGNGDGTFQTQVTYAVGNSPVALAAIALNSDGPLDLVVANRSDNTLGVLLGNGDGTFQTQVTYSVGNAPVAVVAADFNGDGNIDLAAANNNDNTLSLLLGNGDGTFQAQTALAVNGAPAAMAVQDFNGDGLADLATVGNASPSTVNVLLSQHVVSAAATGVSLSSPGTNNVFASYPGDDSHAASQSTTVPLNGPALTATTTTLTASPNPAVAGQTVTFTATVSPTPTGAPLGTVSFYNGATLLGTATVNASGIATFTTSSLPAGTASITATYSGNTNFATSTSAILTETITAAGPTATTTTLTASPNPAVAGQTVTFTATVSPTPTGAPLGTVSFYNGATLLGTATVNASGIATFICTNFVAGTDNITAVYSGNSGFAPSTSMPLNLTVTSASAYTITAPQTPFTVTAGGSVKVKVFLPPVGGAYNQLVTMSAAGLPSGAAVSFAPPSVVPGIAGVPTMMTIYTAAQVASIPENRHRQFPLTPIGLAAGICIFAGGPKRLRKSKMLLLMALMSAAMMTVACGGGFMGRSAPQSHRYVITITGTSGTLHPSTTITLIVQQ